MIAAQASPLKRVSKSTDAITAVAPSLDHQRFPKPTQKAIKDGQQPAYHGDSSTASPGTLIGQLPPGRPLQPSIHLVKNLENKKNSPGSSRKSGLTRGSNAISKKRSGLLADAFRHMTHDRAPASAKPGVRHKAADSGSDPIVSIDLTGQADGPQDEQKKLEMQKQIADAIEKLYPEADAKSKRDDLVLAPSFLEHMDSTLCFLTVAFRMLSKASWKSRMVTVHVRQAVLAAIGCGWWVWDEKKGKFPLSRAELALAAPLPTKVALSRNYLKILLRPFSQ